MPRTLLASLRSTLREIERYEKISRVRHQLLKVKSALWAMIATLEARQQREDSN